MSGDIYYSSICIAFIFSLFMFIKLLFAKEEKLLERYFFGFALFFIIFLFLIGLKYRLFGFSLILFNAFLIIVFGIMGLLKNNNNNE